MRKGQHKDVPLIHYDIFDAFRYLLSFTCRKNPFTQTKIILFIRIKIQSLFGSYPKLISHRSHDFHMIIYDRQTVLKIMSEDGKIDSVKFAQSVKRSQPNKSQMILGNRFYCIIR